MNIRSRSRSESFAKRHIWLFAILAWFVTIKAHAQIFTAATVAGCGSCSVPNNGDLGPATSAYVPSPSGIALDTSGNLYIADSNSRIRKVSPNGTITTVAGSVTATCCFSGDGGSATLAGLNNPAGVAVDAHGNIYVADSWNNRIRKVTPDGKINTIVGGGKGCAGQVNALGDGCPATSATLGQPNAVTVDSVGNVYIADTLNQRIRKVTTNGMITTVAGTGCCVTGDGGPATAAYFGNPASVALDGSGNIYICCGDGRVRKVLTDGIITTVAGNGLSASFKGDGGLALIAELDNALGVAVDVAGQIYISDSAANRVRRVTLDGTINTIAGGGNGCTGQSDAFGDGCPATSAPLNHPLGLAIDSAGNVYVADQFNQLIRLLNPGTAITLTGNAFGENTTIAPNTWMEIKGSHLAPLGDARTWQASDFASNKLPTQLDGVSVTVNGKKAFIYYISGTQVNFLTPPDPMTGTIQVQLTNGATTATSTALTQQYSTSFFVFDGSHVTGTHLDGSLLGPTSLYPGLSTPAKPGETVVLYANGFGPTSVPVVSGSVTQSGTLSPLPAVKIGGLAATVQFAGLVSPGLYQFNVVVPNAAQDGDNALTATYNGQSAQAGVLIAVKH